MTTLTSNANMDPNTETRRSSALAGCIEQAVNVLFTGGGNLAPMPTAPLSWDS